MFKKDPLIGNLKNHYNQYKLLFSNMNLNHIHTPYVLNAGFGFGTTGTTSSMGGLFGGGGSSLFQTPKTSNTFGAQKQGFGKIFASFFFSSRKTQFYIYSCKF